jgi:hypothetical protein
MGNPTAGVLCVTEQGDVWAALSQSWHAFEASLETASTFVHTSVLVTSKMRHGRK